MANLFRGLLGAARDPQFRQDIKNGLLNAAAGATQGLTTDALGAPVDLINMALSPLGLGSQNPVGGSNWLANKAVAGGLLAPPPVNNLQYNAGRMLGPIAAMGAPDAAEALGRGLLDFASHSGRINPYAGQLGAIVYHGSPHKFDAFDLSKIGTGEGAQAYGHGLYLAESPVVAGQYKASTAANMYDTSSGVIRSSDLVDEIFKQSGDVPKQLESGYRAKANEVVRDLIMGRPAAEIAGEIRSSKYGHNYGALADAVDRLAPKASQGSMYTVDLPDEAIAKMLDWDKPLSEQAPEVRAAFQKLGIDESVFPQWTGQQAYEGEVRALTEFDGVPKGDARKRYSEQLRSLGIPGIRYLDGGSRGAGQGTSNYVVFDDKLLKILKRE